MKSILHETISKFHSHLKMLLEDIKLEREGYELAFYFDTGHLQRAALGYKDYYRDDNIFKGGKFKDDITLVCSLISGGFVGQFRLLAPHQDEFLAKINSEFDGTGYDDWKAESRKFVNDTELDLNADEFLSQLRAQNNEDLIRRFTEHVETTKKAFNVSHCLLPWDRRVTGWNRKKLLYIDDGKPEYDAIFSSHEFEALKGSFDQNRNHQINNFIDATALSILVLKTREFKNGDSKLAPRFFLPRSEANNYSRTALKDTGLLSQLKYTFEGRESGVLRNEDYFFYRSYFLQKQRNTQGEPTPEWEQNIQKLYEKVSDIVNEQAFKKVEQIDFGEDNSLQEVIDEMENYSFLKNVWIEFINSGELKFILQGLDEIERQFEQARESYRAISFSETVRNELRKIRNNIFDNLDDVRRASILWEEVSKAVRELRAKIRDSNWDEHALFRNRKLFRYGFPQRLHALIKETLASLLSNEATAESTKKATSRMVILFMKARSAEENLSQDELILLTAVLCALDLKTALRRLLSPKRKSNLHYSLKIALVGAELETSYEKGKGLIDELERLYYSENTRATEQADLAVGLTYLYYYAWLAKKKEAERQDVHAGEDSAVNQEINRLINHAIVFAERATSMVSNQHPEQKTYALNQYLFCLVESGSTEHNKKMNEVFTQLNDKRGQGDVWSYMYYDTLAHYLRWRAMRQMDRKQKAVLMKEAIDLSDAAVELAPHDEEIKKFHTKLIDESDPVGFGA